MHTPVPQGFLVVIDGIDGAGKTTQVVMLAEACERLGLDCEVSKEPTNGQFGSLLRQSAATGRLGLERELELFTLDRKEHIAQLIRPALDMGKVVILDRYYFSTAAYQGALGGDPGQILRENEEFAPIPDLVILLDLPCEVGLERIRQRGDRPNLFERIDMLNAARQIFLGIQHPRLITINSLLPIPEIHEAIFTAFQTRAVELIALRMNVSEEASLHNGVARDATSRTLQVLGEEALASFSHWPTRD